jgi:hypothetical protein
MERQNQSLMRWSICEKSKAYCTVQIHGLNFFIVGRNHTKREKVNYFIVRLERVGDHCGFDLQLLWPASQRRQQFLQGILGWLWQHR